MAGPHEEVRPVRENTPIDSGGNDYRGHNEKTRGQKERIDRKKEKEPPDSRTGVVGLHVAFHTESPSKPCAVPVRGFDWEHALAGIRSLLHLDDEGIGDDGGTTRRRGAGRHRLRHVLNLYEPGA